MGDLIRQAKEGNEDAYSRIVEREQASLRAFIACRVRSPETAEDLAQEAFVVAYQQLDKFDPSCEFWPWLRGIARNLILNERRKLARREAFQEKLVEQAMDSSEESGCDDGAVYDALATCLTRVSDKMRQFIDFRYRMGLELAEIAQKLGITSGSARVIHVRLLRALRKCVEQKSTEVIG